MRVAILGGSFNPVHVGHLFLADGVLSGLGYDRIILVPAFQSPFKIGVSGASPQDRLDMLAASIAGDPRLTIDDCEIRREGVSYTIDTIADIRKRYGLKGKPGLILGDDLAPAFVRWRKADEIACQADIIIARRLFNPPNRGDEAPSEEAPEGRDLEFPFPYTGLNNEVINVSSRLVREKIFQGENWRYLVPSGARFIIEDRNLYRQGSKDYAKDAKASGVSWETAVVLENASRKALSPSRFLHSRNTALLAWDLCVRYCLDPLAGYLAGITHDMCKPMDDKDLVRLARKDGGTITRIEQEKPALLHGRAAAVLLTKNYGITDSGIIEAVRHHVTASRDMGGLAKVVYIADKIEVSRDWVDPALRDLSDTASLDRLFETVVEYTITCLRHQGKEVSRETLRLLAALGIRKKHEKKE
ncbi:MAG: nicotinate (nicotinamide) nucleotide adenylyltransferase [Treponema sp.]|jgi:nicotinate-nucleotide adenylyltransferase|nr:nicotinate (nicotinamide) nucleotide adenylyltransferase [Treponema sp.]